MDSKPAYPVSKTYGAFIHRELSVSWLVLATLLGGRHRIDPGLLSTGFRYLDFGCGHGLNLLFNAAAHPQASFYGLDLNPTHIAEANAKAGALGLGNVHFALADLTDFAEGLPSTGPCRGWPESYDFVVAHGLASWVGPEVRKALVAAAGSLLRPGGIFYCSYNTYPGWLARSTLQMLSVEEGLRTGGSTSVSGIQQAAELLTRLTGPEAEPWPLGQAFPGLRELERHIQAMPESYLVGEYQAAHQPLYVGPMHRLCASHGLTHVGSATLPEMFPELLDPGRRALVLEACDAPMREVLLDLVTNQTFRRDLFVRGACPPPPAWRRRTLEALELHLGGGGPDATGGFATSFGLLELEGDFPQRVRSALADGPRSLGELIEPFALDLEGMLKRLTLLLWAGMVGAAFPSVPGAEVVQTSIADFNRRCLDLATAGEEIGAQLSPVLGQPIPLTLLESFFLQAAEAALPSAELVPLVWMGLSMAGATVSDAEGRPFEDPQAELEHLQDFWDTFARERLPVLGRLGIGPAFLPAA